MGLRAASRIGRTPTDSFNASCNAAFIAAVFQVVGRAYAVLRRRSLAGLDEVAITGELVDALRRIVERETFPPWGFLLSIHDDPPVHGTGQRKKGNSRRRIDVQIEQVHIGPRPRFSFEAKRLREGDAKAVSRYIGADGLGCFVGAQYAAEANVGGMLAYLESGDSSKWVKRLGTAIAERPASRTEADCHWETPSFSPRGIPCRNSRHKRQTLGVIRITHAFLDLVVACSR